MLRYTYAAAVLAWIALFASMAYSTDRPHPERYYRDPPHEEPY